jgi:parallel beta-helix repeat protein
MPGHYHLLDHGQGAVLVTGKDIVLDCSRVRLQGPGKGVGLRILNASNVTVRGLDLSGYRWGVVVEHSTHVVLENCVSSHNGDPRPGMAIDRSGHLPQDQHGGGFILYQCQHCLITGCIAWREWDGADLVDSSNNTLRGNDFSFLDNWGLHLWGSSHITYASNRSIWCATGEGLRKPSLAEATGLDSAGICIEHGSCLNLIDGNDLRFCGDGVLIRANEGPAAPGTVVPPLHPSNDNLIRNNDCSMAANIAIEAVLCDRNAIVHNNCSLGRYGLWLGYSRRTKVDHNIAAGCSVRAVDVENGQEDVFTGNTLVAAPGASPREPLMALYQNGKDATPSGPHEVSGNLFVNSQRPVDLARTSVRASGNEASPPVARIIFADSASVVSPSVAVASGGQPTGLMEQAPRVERVSPSPIPIGNYCFPGRVAGLTADASAPAGLAPATTPALPPHQAVVTIWGVDLLGSAEPVVEVAGVPVLPVSEAPDHLVIGVPADFWGKPAPGTAPLRVLTGGGYSNLVLPRLQWDSSAPRIISLSPDPAVPGAPLTIHGSHLLGPAASPPDVLMDGKLVTVLSCTDDTLVAAAPGGFLSSRTYSVVLSGAQDSPPMPLLVSAPKEWEPQIVSTALTPKKLSVGDLLEFRAVIKNNAPFPLEPAAPGDSHIYAETDSFRGQHIALASGRVYLALTSDTALSPWPYVWGLSHPVPPGDMGEVVGHIRITSPGVSHYRIGLVIGPALWLVRGTATATVTATGRP